MDEFENLLTPAEAAEVLRIGMSRMYELLNTKEITAYRENRCWRIPVVSITEYIQRKCKEDHQI